MSSSATIPQDFLNHVKFGELENAQKIFTRRNVNPNGVDESDMSALHHASQQGKTEVVQWLLTLENILPDKVDKHGWTPLFRACQDGHADVVKLLLQQEAVNVNHRGLNQQTPVWVCASHGYLEVLRVIKEFHDTKPVNLALSVKDEHNSRNELAAIDISIRNGHTEVAEFLRAWEASFPKPPPPPSSNGLLPFLFLFLFFFFCLA